MTTTTGKGTSKATELRLATLAQRRGSVAPPSAIEAYGEVLRLPLLSVVPSPDNPRKHFDEAALQELADSMLAVGVVQPITVLEATPNTYTIVAGERRWRAAKLAKLTHIPAVLYAGGGTAAFQASIVENVQRADLTADEEARAYKALLDSGMTQAQVGKAVGVSQSRVAHRLKVLQLPDGIQALLAEGKLSGSHGEALARWADFPAFATALATLAVEQEPTLSARELAHPFNFDGIFDDDRFEDLYDSVDYELIQRAGCAECPWKAFVPDGAQGWCLKPEHAKEMQVLRNEERHAAAKTRQADAEAVLATARSSVHAAAHTADASTPVPAIPNYHSLPYGSVELLKQTRPLPATCREGTCVCFGQVTLRNEPWDACTQPTRLHSLQSKLKSARTIEMKRRHAEAVELLAEAINAVDHVGPRELAVLGHAISDRGNAYHPNGTGWAEMWRVAGMRTHLLIEKATFDDLGTCEDEVALVKALVETVLLQDLALRFHEQGGRTYGWLAAQYIGEPVPEACPDDWSPSEKGVAP